VRRRNVGLALSLPALALLTACGSSAGNTHRCTLMDAPAGIRVKTAPELAGKVADAALTACWDGVCRKRALRLREAGPEETASPGDPVLTTESPGKSATAAASPDATPSAPQGRFVLPGFVRLPGLPGKPIRVSLVFKDSRGATMLDRQTRVTPKPTYPNGRDCSPGGRQARLTVTEKGALRTR